MFILYVAVSDSDCMIFFINLDRKTDGLKIRDLRSVMYTVSRKKVTPCIHCHNYGKQCQILTEFWNNNAMSNCKQISKFK